MATLDPGPTVLGGGGGGGGGGGLGGTVAGATVGGGAGCAVVEVASVVDVVALVVPVDVEVVLSSRPASITEVGTAAPSPESHAAAMSNMVSANAQIRLRNGGRLRATCG